MNQSNKTIKNLAGLFSQVQAQPITKKLVVAAAHDEHILDAVFMAWEQNIIEPILVGNKKIITEITKEKNYSLKNVEIIDVKDKTEAAIEAVKIINRGEGDILIKGNVDSSIFLRPVLNREYGLRVGETLSHLGIIELPHYHKIFALTDGALNIAPDLDLKRIILKNSIHFMRKLGIPKPKIAALGALELVHPKMQATIDAALLSKMAQRGQIKDCIIEGPLSFDNAISKKSAELKGLNSEVAGEADILLAPNIEAANVLYKSIVYFAGANPACIILGASVPIILTSRSDSEKIKLNSITLAASVNLR